MQCYLSIKGVVLASYIIIKNL